MQTMRIVSRKTGRRFLLAVTLGAAFVPGARACGDPLVPLAREAASEDHQRSGTAIAALRARGIDGLEAFFRVHAAPIQAWKEGRDPGTDWDRITAAIDAIGAQKDCATSRLYWHTEMKTALAEARRTGKPVLSLRLLGKLTEGFC